MPTYRAPIDDYRFLLTELFDAGELSKFPEYADATPDVMVAVLGEGGKLCEEVLAPLNASGDAQGCTWENGVVRPPDGFKAAFRAYADGGWIGLACDPEHGGQGLPLILRYAIDEMACASNLSFAMYPGLAQGAYEAIHAHGSPELQAFYLPRLASGQWAGTMCLTEAHAGTDLGLVRTRAIPDEADGTYRVTGQKIFITAGEHDLTENIVHLVLAKLPGAPAGTRGISMFLVPKFVPNADGSLGARNGVSCGAIEHKMGIKGSATCVLNFDNAVGWLVGEQNKGMRSMFTMMNSARLGVGIQGLGLADVSYHNAVAYARDRQQGRSAGGAKDPGSADPIILHPDIRRGLLAMRAFVEGARALATWIGMRIDVELRHPDQDKREEAGDLVALLTPVIKAFFTDLGFESTNIGLQTFGGHGYIREWGMEQFVRDARIGQIYEGTNHVQALDLVGRKLPEGRGRLLQRYAAELGREIAAAQAHPGLAEFAAPMVQAAGLLTQATTWIAEHSAQDPDEAGAAASEYLRLFGYVALGHMWLRTACAASERLASGGSFQPAFYEAKLAVARFYFQRMLPQTSALYASMTSGAGAVMGFPMEAF